MENGSGFIKRGFKTLSSLGNGNLFKKPEPVKGSEVFNKQASADATSTSAFWYSPELTSESWLLPKSRQEIIKWCRLYYNLEAYVNSIITLLAYYPFSKFDIVTSDKSITEFYNEMAFNENFDLYSHILQASLSHEKFGEALCVTGDTTIPLLNGQTQTIKELYDGKKKNFYLYSIDENKKIQAGLADHVKCNGMRDDIYKITLDNNESLKCTSDHLIMLRDGTYKKAIELTVGESLMPLYRKYKPIGTKYVAKHKEPTKHKYEMVYQPSDGKYYYTHRIIAGRQYKTTVRGKLIHHKDFNHLNNEPTNLEFKTNEEHSRLHCQNQKWRVDLMGKVSRKYWSDPINKERQSKGKIMFYSIPGNKEKMAIAVTEAFKDPIKNQNLRNGLANRDKVYLHDVISKTSKAMWSDPTIKRKILATRAINRKNMIEADKLKWNQNIKNSWTPERRLAQSKGMVNVNKKFGTIWVEKKLGKKNALINHKVVKIEKVDAELVYDLVGVSPSNNFAIGAGIFIHNCFGNIELIKDGAWSGKKKWKNFILLEPELLEIKSPSFGAGDVQYELIPTQEMINIVKSNKQNDIETKKSFPENILKCIEQGRNIPLDPKCISVIQRLTDPSATRGTPKLQSIFKSLIYQDKIRQAQIAAADRYHFPIELWTLGDVANGIMPSEDDLKNTRDMINQAIQNPPFCLDDKSKILTKNGFRGIDEIAKGDIIATYNKEKDCMEYQPCNDVFKFDYSGEMVCFKNDNVDLMVTPEHRCLVQNGIEGTSEFGDWKVELAKNITGTNKMMVLQVIKDLNVSDIHSSCYISHVNVSQPDVSREEYTGRVWCVSVPNTYFISERNGKMVITGNSMVFPPIIKYEALGVSGKLLPVSDDYEYIQDQIMVGLGVNKNIITGDGPSFSNLKSMSLQNFTMMAKVKRDQFENWIINKFFRPIAMDNGFYYYSGKVKKLVLPQISWYKSLDIEEENAERDMIYKMHEKGFVSTKTLFSKFPNLELDVEKKNLEEEKGTVWDKGGNRIPEAFIPGSTPSAGGGNAGGEEYSVPGGGDTGTPGIPEGIPGQEAPSQGPENVPATETAVPAEGVPPAETTTPAV